MTLTRAQELALMWGLAIGGALATGAILYGRYDVALASMILGPVSTYTVETVIGL